MIYKCVDCGFIFKRRNEPSKCPKCEKQYIVEADEAEQQEYKLSNDH